MGHYGARVTPERTTRAGRPYDREIVRLAVPAFGALAAEPLYLLADTAIVGHLGTRPLAGLAVAGVVLTAAFGIFNFLAYSHDRRGRPPARRRRPRGAPRELGVDGMWLAVGLGLVLTVLGLALAPVDRRRDGRVGPRAPVRGDLPPHQRRSARPRCCSRSRGAGLPARHAGHADHARDRGRRERREPRARARARVTGSTSASRGRRGAP